MRQKLAAMSANPTGAEVKDIGKEILAEFDRRANRVLHGLQRTKKEEDLWNETATYERLPILRDVLQDLGIKCGWAPQFVKGSNSLEKRMISEVAPFLPEKFHTATPILAKGSKRGYCRSLKSHDEIALSPGSFDKLRRTVVHELGHREEYRVPHIHTLITECYNNRTAGEPLQPLSVLAKSSKYGPGELARQDKFFSPYVGKDYGGDAHEIFSMGLEYLIRNDSYGADARKGDPDTFEFVMGLLTLYK